MIIAGRVSILKSSIDCIPCFFRQAIEASRRSGLSDEEILSFVGEIGTIVGDCGMRLSAPEIAGGINARIMEKSRIRDAYADAKKMSNDLALSAYADCRRIIDESGDKLRTAVEFAIAGNIIDYGARHDIDVKKEIGKIVSGLEIFVHCDGRFFAYREFRESVRNSRRILYLADNAGETVFDRLLIETIHSEFPGIKITYAVKDHPVLNDAVKDDALYCSLDSAAEVISSGSRIPGTVLEKCSGGFMDHHRDADMIISKGQGNFESFVSPEKDVFYLFMAKCASVAKIVGCRQGTINLLFSEKKRAVL
jgi:uncharacterized protein with ATP-grasp and redox domains